MHLQDILQDSSSGTYTEREDTKRRNKRQGRREDQCSTFMLFSLPFISSTIPRGNYLMVNPGSIEIIMSIHSDPMPVRCVLPSPFPSSRLLSKKKKKRVDKTGYQTSVDIGAHLGVAVNIQLSAIVYNVQKEPLLSFLLNNPLKSLFYIHLAHPSVCYGSISKNSVLHQTQWCQAWSIQPGVPYSLKFPRATPVFISELFPDKRVVYRCNPLCMRGGCCRQPFPCNKFPS